VGDALEQADDLDNRTRVIYLAKYFAADKPLITQRENEIRVFQALRQ
jgi:hypothetical protein